MRRDQIMEKDKETKQSIETDPKTQSELYSI